MSPFVCLATVLTAFVAAGSSNPVWPTWPPKGTESPHSPPSQTANTVSPAPTGLTPPSCSGYFEPTAPPYLNDLAQAAGKLYFGSATDQPVSEELAFCTFEL